ncbi:L-fuconolactonase [Caldalkalibacillus uzonensis]|uniref:L-fuconolactonase n=1 Tax=Caldalkalibacillus uzonensis TaxID=353224 RepID=A0ABU0CPL2_9BACI|nr:amidohydrolase family protein [Caldalkalibacillus uzonensis]MDQ0338324.1 L-fuconolactonase [Caldalkalibacillus uzonensis]
MRIDAHQHFWKLERGDYFWLTPELEEIYRDFLPQDLKSHLERCGIEKTIVVQATSTVEETEFLLSLYAETDFIAGVVGWLDLESETFPQDFDRYRQRQGFVGIRPMLQDLADDKWILRPQVVENISRLVENDFPIDLLIYPRHLPVIKALLQRFPRLRAVIDHLAKPNIAKQEMHPWQEHLAEIANYPNVMCKLSGMITEADHQKWAPDDLRPYVSHALEVFGVERVMFGSDWPVCLLAGQYEEVYQALAANLPASLSAKEADKIFGQNAMRFYKLS